MVNQLDSTLWCVCASVCTDTMSVVRSLSVCVLLVYMLLPIAMRPCPSVGNDIVRSISSILDQQCVSAKAVSHDSQLLAMFVARCDSMSQFRYFIAFNVACRHLRKLDSGFAMRNYSTVVLY